jgi:hypothetical protein
MRDFDPIAGLRDRARSDPEADAIIAADTRLTAAEFWDSAVRFASLLRDDGIGRRPLVASSIECSTAWSRRPRAGSPAPGRSLPRTSTRSTTSSPRTRIVSCV